MVTLFLRTLFGLSFCTEFTPKGCASRLKGLTPPTCACDVYLRAETKSKIVSFPEQIFRATRLSPKRVTVPECDILRDPNWDYVGGQPFSMYLLCRLRSNIFAALLSGRYWEGVHQPLWQRAGWNAEHNKWNHCFKNECTRDAFNKCYSSFVDFQFFGI